MPDSAVGRGTSVSSVTTQLQMRAQRQIETRNICVVKLVAVDDSTGDKNSDDINDGVDVDNKQTNKQTTNQTQCITILRCTKRKT
jgi:hypothetical protein